jgi:hypothetical protein
MNGSGRTKGEEGSLIRMMADPRGTAFYAQRPRTTARIFSIIERGSIMAWLLVVRAEKAEGTAEILRKSPTRGHDSSCSS